MKHVFILVSFLSLIERAAAQTVDIENYSVDYKEPSPQGFFFFNVAMGIPEPALKTAMDRGASIGIASGFGFNPLGQKRKSPFLLGVDFAYHTFGGDNTTDAVTDIPYRTTYNTSFTGLLARFYPFRSQKVAPFVDGIAGLRNLNMRTKEDYESDEPIVVNKQNDRSFGYGIAVGIHSKKPVRENFEPRATFLLRAVYLWGERSKYLKRDSVRVTDGELTYETGFAATSIFQIQVGVILY